MSGFDGTGVWRSSPELSSSGLHCGEKQAGLNYPFTHRLHSSSFGGLPYRILNIHDKRELLWSLWVELPVLHLRLEAVPCPDEHATVV